MRASPPPPPPPDDDVLACEISVFRRGVDEVVALLGCYVAYVGSCLPKFDP